MSVDIREPGVGSRAESKPDRHCQPYCARTGSRGRISAF